MIRRLAGVSEYVFHPRLLRNAPFFIGLLKTWSDVLRGQNFISITSWNQLESVTCHRPKQLWYEACFPRAFTNKCFFFVLPRVQQSAPPDLEIHSFSLEQSWSNSSLVSHHMQHWSESQAGVRTRKYLGWVLWRARVGKAGQLPAARRWHFSLFTACLFNCVLLTFLLWLCCPFTCVLL